MSEKETLQAEINELESRLKPLKERLNLIYVAESDDTEAKVKRCHQLKDKFKTDELIFAAYSRCECGAGMAYPKSIGVFGSWYCSAILLGHAERGTTHSASLPFSMYEVKSENQPSANGATTRPQE